jgi:hypothetical protein
VTDRRELGFRLKRVMAPKPLVTAFKGLCATFTGQRKGDNSVYDMADVGMAAFATILMQQNRA